MSVADELKEVDVRKMSNVLLKEKLNKRGANGSGNKAELVERLLIEIKNKIPVAVKN